MGIVKQTLGRILLWKYDRGSIAFDIIVVLILAFIFLVPRSCFERRIQPGAAKPAAVQPATPTP